MIPFYFWAAVQDIQYLGVNSQYSRLCVLICTIFAVYETNSTSNFIQFIALLLTYNRQSQYIPRLANTTSSFLVSCITCIFCGLFPTNSVTLESLCMCVCLNFNENLIFHINFLQNILDT